MIDCKMYESDMMDVMGGEARWEVRVHEHGMVALIDVMPRSVPAGATADCAIVQAARVSYGQGTRQVSEDRDLIRYLMRHGHMTPFEMIECKFHVVAPIFTVRQWMRHRSGHFNECSARYSEVPDRFYRPAPDHIGYQSTVNRQGSGDPVPDEVVAEFDAYLDASIHQHAHYRRILALGVARETARIGLPLAMYTEFYWKVDLRNLFNFLAQRLAPDAQWEIRDYAGAVFAMARGVAPVACEAFEDYVLESVRLTRLEVEALRTGELIASSNRRERAEWDEKRKHLGMEDAP